VAPIGAVGIIEDPPDARPNQGQTKLEDVPGRYRLEFSPSDPDQEDIVTVYECDPSSGESTVPNPSPSPGGATTSSPSPSPPRKPRHLLLPRLHHRPLRLPRLLPIPLRPLQILPRTRAR
jgi:hypothetical protein